jgi:vesicle-associated membrane protein 4
MSQKKTKVNQNEQKSNQKIHEVEVKIEEVTTVMKGNVQKALEGCEKLGEMEEKTLILEKEAGDFKRGATKVRWHFQCIHYKLMGFIALIILVLALILYLSLRKT